MEKYPSSCGSKTRCTDLADYFVAHTQKLISLRDSAYCCNNQNVAQTIGTNNLFRKTHMIYEGKLEMAIKIRMSVTVNTSAC